MAFQSIFFVATVSRPEFYAAGIPPHKNIYVAFSAAVYFVVVVMGRRRRPAKHEVQHEVVQVEDVEDFRR